MDNASLNNVGVSLRTISGLFAERHRQSGQGGVAPFPWFGEGLDLEVGRLRAAGHGDLADAIAALRDEIEVMDNA